MASSAYVEVYPYPLEDLKATDGVNTITIDDEIIDSDDHYEFEVGTGCTLGCTDITVSAYEYKPQTKNCYTDTTHTFTLEEDKPRNLYAYTDINAVSSPLYAWTCDEGNGYGYYGSGTVHTIYTDTLTPTKTSIIYNEKGEKIGTCDNCYVESYTINSMTTGTTGNNEPYMDFYAYIPDPNIGPTK